MNLWAVSAANPRRKARKAKSNPRRARTAAQKAATARMLAANRAKSPSRRRARRGSAVATVRSQARRAVRRASSAMGGVSMHNMGGSAMSLIKGGAIGAGGALGVDLAMGFLNPMLPASFAAKLNADGSPNYLNYAAKGAVAMAVGVLGAKVMRPAMARELAAGSFTVMAYELLRPLAVNVLPASMSLGWMSPGRIMGQPGMARYDSAAGMGRLGKMGAYQAVTEANNAAPMANNGLGRGAMAARRMG